MKSMVLTVIIMGFFQSIFGQNNEIVQIEKSLKVRTPEDLKAIWLNQASDLKHRIFKFGTYYAMYFLFPGDSIKQFNGTYKTITEFSDVYNEDNRHLVFATSVFEQAFVKIYYKFDRQGNSLGIYVSNGDQGSITPVKIGENISDVFPNIISTFRMNSDYYSIERDYSNQNPETLFADTIGIFPKKTLFRILDETVTKENYVIYQNNALKYVSDSIMEDISDLYEKHGMVIDFNNPFDESRGHKVDYLHEFVNAQNIRVENDSKAVRMFNISFGFQDMYAVVICNRAQARELNTYGLFIFDWDKRAEKENRFMYE